MSDRPNIVLLVMDSARAESMSCYGAPRPTTPHLEDLARESTLYTRASSVGCWTLPVHATLFTGLFPARHGLTISRDALPEGFPTLARRLSGAGYDTACFSNNPYISSATGLAQGFRLVEDLWRSNRPRGTAKPRGQVYTERLEGGGPGARLALPLVRSGLRARSQARRWRSWTSTRDSGARTTNDHLRSWLVQRADSNRPFFAFVNYMETHEPYRPPHPFNERFLPGRSGRIRAARLGSKTAVLAAAARGETEAIDTLRALYEGTLAYLDEQIGELVEGLRELGALDDTLLVVTSDHGDSLGEHGHLGHRLFLYEQLVHVPLLVRYPARFPAGARRDPLVQLGDLHPTILELAGAGGEARDGVETFVSLLDEGSLARRRYAVAENTAPKALGSVRMRMLRGDRHKYIWRSDGTRELYDLGEDPGELENLAASRGDLVDELHGELDGWERGLVGEQVETREAAYDEETARRLRGLGYIG
ncbi:MAG: sulfatase [Gaiellales bacterium]